MRYQDPNLRKLLAGEYVLGSMHGRARKRFESLMREDAELRKLVTHWARDLEPLNDHLETVSPPAHVWTNIEQHIGPTEETGEKMWSNVVFWRRLGSIAVAASLVLAVFLGVFQYRTVSPERVAFLNDDTDQPVWMVSTSSRSREFRIKTLQPMPMPAGEFCVLWLVWKDGASEGVAILPDNTGEMSVRLPRGMKRDPNKAELVVTVETGDDAVSNMQGKVIFKGPWVEL